MSSGECSFFYQSMDNVQGDLTDIVRGGGCCIDPITDDFKELSADASSVSPRPIKPAAAAPLVSSPRTLGSREGLGKGQEKRVICIPAPPSDQESSKITRTVIVPSDLWAWRKYGQKPIKGSPHPRGYYRCSSSKGCSARKQVERSRSDPNMLVITYTSEHNHPWPTHGNSLSGSTRSSSQSSSKTYNTSNKSTSPHDNQNLSPSSSKQEPDDMLLISSSTSPLDVIKEENLDFERVFDQSYEPIMLGYSNDMEFFDELGGLDPDPTSFFFSSRELKLEEEGENKALDPLSYFDWDGN